MGSFRDKNRSIRGFYTGPYRGSNVRYCAFLFVPFYSNVHVLVFLNFCNAEHGRPAEVQRASVTALKAAENGETVSVAVVSSETGASGDSRTVSGWWGGSINSGCSPKGGRIDREQSCAFF